MRLKFPRLDLGCASRKKENFTGIDLFGFDYPRGEFIKGDVFRVIRRIRTNSIEKITSNQFIEHIPKDKFIGFMNQCYRILKVGGEFECTFPPAVTKDGTPNFEFYADPWHVNAIMPGTFACFSKRFRDNMLRDSGGDYRGYGIECDFETVEVNYIIKSQVYIRLIKDYRNINNPGG
jgi:hypothetical protein